jgi:hypothetical protein
MKALEPPHPERQSKTLTPERLVATHVIERISPYEMYTKSKKRCIVCCKTSGRRKDFILA